ncbi:hypothetical protein [Lactobacillus sp. ESL0791]
MLDFGTLLIALVVLFDKHNKK